ncbi:MAG: hypothetical protein HC837_19340 [Chloroflexaceae bacterium]|nr:hypothetical protein [Chloroflexaceae bacterium]
MARSTWYRLHDDRPLLGITTINWAEQNRSFKRQAIYETALLDAARWFIEQEGGRVVCLPQVCGPSLMEEDMLPARRIAAQLGNASDALMVIETAPPTDVLHAAYGLTDLLIGTRMHSNIFALTNGVPVVAIGYRHKTMGMMEMLGLERYVIDIAQVDSNTLTALLQAAWNEHATLRAQLPGHVGLLAARARLAGHIIRADYYVYQRQHER